MPPQSIRWFERALLAALAIDLVNNLVAWPTLAARLAAAGVAAVTPVLLVTYFASPAIGLLLWYLIARRASNVARWVMTVLIALAVLAFARTLLHPIAPGAGTVLIVAAIAEALKLFAVVCLFRADARPWFARAPAA